ncbi:MAG: hypothetical protein ACXV3D_07825 [Halobacteriota archaeon]
MIITEVQRFIYGLLALTFGTISVFVFLNVYSLEIFVVFLIIEFLVMIELTKPSFLRLGWRRNLSAVVAICVIVFLIIVYRAASLIR